MKRSRMTLLAYLSTALLCLASLRAMAQGETNVDDLAAQAYLSLLSGDTARNNQNWVASLKSYEDALAVYQQIRDLAPEYKTEIMEYRLQYCREMIDEVSGKAATQPVSASDTPADDGYKARYDDLLEKSRRLASMVQGLQNEAARARELEQRNLELTGRLGQLEKGDVEAARLGQRVQILQDELANAKAELAALQSKPAPGGMGDRESETMRKDLREANEALLASQQALRQADETLQELRRQLAGNGSAGQAQVAALDAELQKVRKEKELAETALQNLRAETGPMVDALTQEQQSLNQRLSEASKRILNLEAQLRNTGGTSAAQVASLREELRQGAMDAEAMRQRVATLENELRDAADRHAGELESLRSETRADGARETQRLESENRKTLAQVRELENRLSAMAGMEAEWVAAKAEASAAQAQLDGFREATAAQLAESRRQAALATAQQEAMASRMRELETQSSQLAANHAALSKERDQLAARVRELIQGLDDAKRAGDKSEEIGTLTASLEEARREQSRLERAIAGLRQDNADRIDALQSELDLARQRGARAAELEPMAEALAKAQAEKAALAEKFADVEARSGTWQTQLETALREVARESALRAELERNNQATREALATETGRVNALESELAAEKNALAKALQDIQGKAGAQREALAERIQSLEKEKAEREAAITKSSDLIAGLEADLRIQGTALAELQGKYEEQQANAETALRQSETIRAEAMEELAGAQAKAAAQAETVARLEQSLAAFQTHSGTQKEELAGMLLETRRAKDAMEEQLTLATAKRNKLETDLAGLERSLAEAMEAERSASGQLKEMSARLLAAREAGEATSALLEKSKAEGKELETRLAEAMRAQSESAASGEVSARLREEMKILQEEKKILEIQQRDTLGQFERLNQQYENLSRDHRAALEKTAAGELAETKWAEAEKVLVELRQQEQGLRARVSDLQAQLQDIDTRHAAELNRKDEAYRNLSELLASQREEQNKELEALRASLTAMAGETESVAGESRSLQAMLQESFAAKEATGVELAAATALAKEQAAEIEVLNAGLAESKAMIEEQARIMAGLQAQAERVGEFQSKLVEETETRKLAEQNLRKLADHIAEMRKEIAADKKRQAELQDELAKLVETNTQLARFKAEAEAAEFSLRESRESELQARADLGKLKLFVKQVAEENTERQKNFETMRAELALLQAKVPEQEGKIADLSAELDQTQGDAVNLATRLEEASQRVAQLEKVEMAFQENLGQFKTLSDQYQDLATAYQALQAAYVSATNEWTVLRQQVGLMEEALGENQTQNLDLHQRLQAGTANIALMQAQLQAAEASLKEADALREQAKAMEASVETLHLQNKEYQQLATSLQQEFRATLQQVETLQRDNSALEKTIEGQAREISALSAKAAASEQALRDAGNTVAQAKKLEADLASLRMDVAGAMAEREKTEADLASSVARHQAAEAAKAALEKQLADTTRQLLEAEVRIKELADQQQEVLGRLRRVLGQAN